MKSQLAESARHRPWRWKSSREPVTVSDSRSKSRGSYPGRSRLRPDGATIVANGDCQRSVIGDVGRRFETGSIPPLFASAVPWVFAFSMQAQQSIVVDPKSPGSIDSPRGLILFDGVCVLCSRGSGFVSKRDRRAYFRFVPIQLAEGRPLAEQLGINPDRPVPLRSWRTDRPM
jgi:hypothetical protein